MTSIYPISIYLYLHFYILDIKRVKKLLLQLSAGFGAVCAGVGLKGCLCFLSKHLRLSLRYLIPPFTSFSNNSQSLTTITLGVSAVLKRLKCLFNYNLS